MSDTNKIEKLTFITLYDATEVVGTVKQQKPRALPGVCESKPVRARLRASYCAEASILMFETSADHDALATLPWLPGKVIKTINGLTVTQTVDKIVDLWDDQKIAIEQLCKASTDDGWIGPKPDPVVTMNDQPAEYAGEPAAIDTVTMPAEDDTTITIAMNGHAPISHSGAQFSKLAKQVSQERRKRTAGKPR